MCRLNYAAFCRLLISSFCLLIAFPCSFAAAAQKKGDSGWLEVRSEHFTVISDAPEEVTRTIATRLEQVRAAYFKLFPQGLLDPAQPFVVIAAKNTSSLGKFMPVSPGSGPDFADVLRQGGGSFRVSYTLGATRCRGEKCYVVIHLPEREPLSPLQRLQMSNRPDPFELVNIAYAGALLRRNLPLLPAWLYAGLVSFYSTAQASDREIRIGDPSPTMQWYYRSKRVPLAELFTAAYPSRLVRDDYGTRFSPHSWAVVHYLLVARGGDPLAAFLTQINGGQDQLRAAELAFGDLDKLATDVHTHITRKPLRLMKVTQPINAAPVALSVGPLQAAQLAALRGDIQLRFERFKEAESVLQESLKSDRQLAFAHESMGSLYLAQKRHGDAAVWLAKAIELDPQNHFSHYQLALAYSQAGTDKQSAQRAEEEFRRAISLQPEFAPAYSQLADLFRRDGRKLSEALTLAQRAVELEPGRESHQFVLCRILLAIGRHDLAGNLARRLLASAALESAYAEADLLSKTIAGVRQSLSSAKGGVLEVRCESPAVIELTLKQDDKELDLRSPDFRNVAFFLNSTAASSTFMPCENLKGARATIVFTRPDAGFPGNIVSIQIQE